VTAKLSTEDTAELIIGIVLIGLGLMMVAFQWILKPKNPSNGGGS